MGGRKESRNKIVKLRFILFPIAVIYGMIASLRRFFYRKGWCKTYIPIIPTIGVGNLSMGGTGKTPHVEYLIRLLEPKLTLATLSRGYRRKTKGFVLANDFSDNTLSAETIGDEPLQFHTKFPKVKVAVCEERSVGIQQLQQRFPDLSCVILDDCYQHLAVKPQLRILITEYEHPYCNDYPLPVGRLREFRSAAIDADAVIVSKSPSNLNADQVKMWRQKLQLLPSQQLFFTAMQYNDFQPLNEAAKQIDICTETEIILLTAIAHPEPLYDFLFQKYKILYHARFSDHHYFTNQEIKNIINTYFSDNQNNRIIITTEKDSMRLIQSPLSQILSSTPIFSIGIAPLFLFDEGSKFNQWIENNIISL